MDAPNFAAMTAEDLLSLIEDANKALDQKIAAEKADIDERHVRLTKLLARRTGTEAKPAKKPTVAKPRGRPAQAAAAKPVEQAVDAQA